MPKIKLEFIKTGLHTSVQDLGRLGNQAYGIPVNGAMDKSSYRLANDLVGNKPGSPVLEITLIGPEIRFQGSGQIAITGANISPMINGRRVKMYNPILVNEGDRLKFGKCLRGCRSYLAVRGNWEVKKWLNSASASTVDGKELTPDSIIQEGSVISVHDSSKSVNARLFEGKKPSYSSNQTIRMIAGPEYEQLTRNTIEDLFRKSFSISQDADRMGYRLNESLVDFNPENEVISSGIVPGTIQITNSGLPIILMADGQTSGGYFRMGNVITEDLDKLAQMKPGDQLRLKLVPYHYNSSENQ